METENIQSVLAELSRLGMTDEEIGKRIGAAQSIITRLRNGVHKSTSYERGLEINRLLRERRAQFSADA